MVRSLCEEALLEDIYSILLSPTSSCVQYKLRLSTKREREKEKEKKENEV